MDPAASLRGNHHRIGFQLNLGLGFQLTGVGGIIDGCVFSSTNSAKLKQGASYSRLTQLQTPGYPRRSLSIPACA
jgi:hypothetical protein